MPLEKVKNSSYLIYNIISFSNMAEKPEFSEKIGLIWTCSEISIKSWLLRKSATILNDVK